jgi:hypothetical protein
MSTSAPSQQIARRYQSLRGEPRRNRDVDEEQRRLEMNRAFRQACERLGLTGPTPVVELVAVRILELARDGECDPDKLTDAAVLTFEG